MRSVRQNESKLLTYDGENRYILCGHAKRHLAEWLMASALGPLALYQEVSVL